MEMRSHLVACTAILFSIHHHEYFAFAISWMEYKQLRLGKVRKQIAARADAVILDVIV